ncbi:hypothetical protein GJ496_000448 [Pomphorhynchus laevis]|nr:hypothetical protein GJ496_000448 [Pomphorhynchus laevis]
MKWKSESIDLLYSCERRNVTENFGNVEKTAKCKERIKAIRYVGQICESIDLLYSCERRNVTENFRNVENTGILNHRMI